MDNGGFFENCLDLFFFFLNFFEFLFHFLFFFLNFIFMYLFNNSFFLLSSTDKSLSVNCESVLEGCESGSVYFESMYDFDDYSQNLKSNSFQDFQNALPNYTEKSFKQNSSSCSNILSSSGEREIVDLIPREKCSSHKDRDAVWACKGHCHKKFCEICFEKIGFKTHGKLIKISELINTNIDSLKK